MNRKRKRLYEKKREGGRGEGRRENACMYTERGGREEERN